KVDNVQTSLNMNTETVNNGLMNNNRDGCSDIRNKKFADIVMDNKLDNKIIEIPTEVIENGNEVVVLDDEMIELGCKIWKRTVWMK
ncbi:hypothetical protein Tco_0230308, partial [Tanacetum coccineum]